MTGVLRGSLWVRLLDEVHHVEHRQVHRDDDEAHKAADEAIEMIRAAGVTDRQETKSILRSAVSLAMACGPAPTDYRER